MTDFEMLLERFYRSCLRPGDVAVDVGAHTGRHTVPMLHAVFPGGRVIAFEPLPAARNQLEERVRGETTTAVSITVHPFALSDHEGTEEFVIAIDLPGYSGLKERVYDYPTRIDRIPVEVRTLDGLLSDVRRLHYVKIDAEGGELNILKGATRLIDRFAPVVSFEFGANTLEKYGIAVEDMASFWNARQYGLFDILGQSLTTDAFEESAKRQEVWDYVALPNERVRPLLQQWREGS